MNKEEILKEIEHIAKCELYDTIGVNYLKSNIEKLFEENKQLKEEIQDLKADYGNKAQVERDLLQLRINKAIEYIEYNDESLYTFEPDYDYEEELVDNYEPSNYREDLLEILKGE